MFGYSAADWIFIGGVMVVIVICVAASDMRRRK
jgi:hypothetical protein